MTVPLGFGLGVAALLFGSSPKLVDDVKLLRDEFDREPSIRGAGSLMIAARRKRRMRRKRRRRRRRRSIYSMISVLFGHIFFLNA